MSLRATARSLDERVADLEALQRRLSGDAAIRPRDIRYDYVDKGDILIGTGPGTVKRLPAPPFPPRISNGLFVLRANPGLGLGMDWAFLTWDVDTTNNVVTNIRIDPT